MNLLDIINDILDFSKVESGKIEIIEDSYDLRDVYEEILYKFYRTIDKKEELIKKYFKEKNIKNYTVEVHGLKSASKFIGAEKLSNLAAYLEKCVNDNNVNEIEEKTNILLDVLNEYRYNINLYFENKDTVEKEQASKEDILKIVELLKEALENFNIVQADEEIKKMKSYNLDERMSRPVNEVENALDDVDYEKCLDIIEKM